MQLLFPQAGKLLVQSQYKAFCLGYKFCSGNNKKLQAELLNNPKFDEAFPNLKRYKPETSASDQSVDNPFMDTLKKYHQSSKIEKFTDLERMAENQKRFVEGFQSPRGPLKYMDEESKLKINILIDAKLKELEDTGLSRDEIMTNGKKKGLPLTHDAFFQHIKSNYNARYVYIFENEEYTVQKVIDLAIRQNLGPDQFGGAIHPQQLNNKQPVLKTKPHKPYNPVLATSQSNKKEMINQLIKQDKIFAKSPGKFVTKSGGRKINNYDIHWRNTEFLSQFLNSSGKIMNRFQTHLKTVQQKKVSRAIKTARDMLLIPHQGYVLPHYKKNLSSLQEDVYDFVRKKVNLTTGQLYQETPSLMKDRNLEDQAQQLDYEIQQSSSNTTSTDLKFIQASIYADKLKEEQLISEGLNITAIKNEYESGHTKRFATIQDTIKFDNIRNEDQIKLSLERQTQPEQIKPQVFEDVKVTYQFNQFNKSDIKKIPMAHLPEAIIFESALDYGKLIELHAHVPKTKISKEESLKIINGIRHKGGLKSLTFDG